MEIPIQTEAGRIVVNLKAENLSRLYRQALFW